MYPLVGVDASGLAALRAQVALRLVPAYAVPAYAASGSVPSAAGAAGDAAGVYALATGSVPLATDSAPRAASMAKPTLGRRTTRRNSPAQRTSAGPRTGTGTSSRRPPADSDSLRMMELVERAQSGEAEAFGRLYDHYCDTVYRYIYYRVGSKATAEDLTSETFLRALRRIGTFTWQGRDFGAWLVTIARNLVADHFKSSRFRLEVTTGEMLDANEVERSPEDAVLESLSNEALLQAVRKLNPQQQECVTLRFLQGLSVAETAQIMGKNEGAIKTLQYRAVRTLARLLPDDIR
ncbi:MAG: sigma-70 family RNA polymerase sigma factor [Streptomycetaceae bacterium]|nr:sigma-70 family RNA polymerase sigma factor [Streptomycetaceae bacterium]